MSQKIPFHRPSIGEEEILEVVDTTGPKVRQFEREFAAYVGAKDAVGATRARPHCSSRSRQWKRYAVPKGGEPGSGGASDERG
jgi:hypothetical protein